jgi:hypothetical protein
MFIDSTTQRRVNIYQPYKGFSKLDTPEIRQRAGVIEIADPVPPADYSDETYYRTEQDDAPYVIFTKKSDEQLAALAQSKLNQSSLAYLAETDWMVTRFAETAMPIPDDVKLKRQSARDAIVYPPKEVLP